MVALHFLGTVLIKEKQCQKVITCFDVNAQFKTIASVIDDLLDVGNDDNNNDI